MNDETRNDALARVYLQPIAAPSILGLYGFAGATFMVAAHLAGWYGGSNTTTYLLPFAATFGGLAQFTAAMWSFKARDGVGTAMHGTWGSFWMAYGILYLMFATGVASPPAGVFAALGFWYIVLAAITFMGALAAMAENVGLTLVLLTLAAGSVLAAIAELIGSPAVTVAAGWVLVVSAVIAWYTASALMLKGVGKPFLPIGEMPIKKKAPKINVGAGEPGVQHGQ